MARLEVSVVEFREIVTIGGRGWPTWSAKAPEHDPYGGRVKCREVRDADGVTRAVFMTYEAGPVVQEVEVPAANIRSICRLPVTEIPPKEEPLPAPQQERASIDKAAKAGAR